MPSLAHKPIMEANGNGKPPNQQNHPTKLPAGNNYGLQQAYNIRNIAAEQTLALRDEPAVDLKAKVLRARAIRDMAAVWDNACERLRILRGRPLPGSLKPKAPARKRKAPTGPLFSMEEDTPAELSTRADSAPPDVPPQS